MKFIIYEKENINSIREGTLMEAKSLRGAKQAAAKRKVFCNTVLTITNEAGELLAHNKNGQWVNGEESK